MTEELKQKAKEFIDRINKESDGMWLNNYYLSDLLVMFATENGIQWHDLRKDPNDLPEKIKLVLIRLVGCYVLGWYDGIDFYNDCNKGEKIPKELFIAWCEIPQFKE